VRAIILAAGEGTRLRPHTLERPKCLVEIGGVPLLHRQLAALEACGVEDVTLVTGYCATALAGVGYPTRHNPDYDHTNMVWSLMCAADLLDGSDDVLISYGDIVYEPRVLRALLACPDAFAICVDRRWRSLWELRMEDPLADAETLRLDDHGRVLEIGRTPRSFADIHAQYMGLIKLRADFAPKLVLSYRELGDPHLEVRADLARLDMTSFLQKLVERGHTLRAASVDSGWLEVDTTRDLATYEEMERAGTLASLYRSSAVPAWSRKA
jgi:choline kinase